MNRRLDREEGTKPKGTAKMRRKQLRRKEDWGKGRL